MVDTSKFAIAKRVKARLQETGKTNTGLARACGVSVQAITAWLRDGSIAKEHFPAMATYLETGVDFLLTGRKRPYGIDPGQPLPYAPIAAMQPEAAYLIPIYEQEGSMGNGREAKEEDTVIGGLQVSKEWVRRNLPSITSPSNLAVITGLGDSMSPTFNDGDILLVDRGVSAIKLDAIYVLERSNDLFIKRLQRKIDGGDLVMQSDNPVLRPEVIPNGALESGQVTIKGRVVYAWNGKRL